MIPITKPDIVSSEIIKPSSAAKLDHPRIYNFSFFDQICSRIYLPFIFFYPKQHIGHNPSDEISHKSILLKKSLSSALSLYYPLAGRLKNDLTINCNDEGIEFNEARIEYDLSDFLKNPRDETLKILFPEDLQYKDPMLSSFFIFQVTFFNCGGMALAICISHKIMDIASASYFIKNWAAIARNPGEKMCPDYDIIQSQYPSIDLPALEIYEPDKVKCVSRRLVFEGSKIKKLKSMVEKQVPNPTRFEVVTALLYESAISAARAFSGGSTKPTFLHIGTNLRNRVVPPLPENSAGNFSGTFAVSAAENSRKELEWLTSEIKKKKMEYWDLCAIRSSIKDLSSYILEASTEFRSGHGKEEDGYLCSSFCRYPFYEADFGWGKPAWVTFGSCEVKNVIILMDTRGGDGIEAYVCLQEQIMDIFEHDHHLLSFACINPTALPETN